MKQQDLSLGRHSKKFCVFVSCLEELNDKCDLSDEASRVFSFLIYYNSAQREACLYEQSSCRSPSHRRDAKFSSKLVSHFSLFFHSLFSVVYFMCVLKKNNSNIVRERRLVTRRFKILCLLCLKTFFGCLYLCSCLCILVYIHRKNISNKI